MELQPPPELPPAPNLDLQLALRLAALRAAAGWSLDDLSQRTGISRATLSRLERGETSPSASLLGKLAHAHQISLSRLLADVDAAPVRLLRAADQPRWHDAGNGFERRMRCPPLMGYATEVIEARLQPGAHIVYDTPTVFGLEHHLCLLAGAVCVTLGPEAHERHALAAGDSLSFRSTGRTAFETLGPAEAHYLMAMTPPQR